jgi:plastocyanin
MDRRTVLRLSGVTLAGSIAGCGGSTSEPTATETDLTVEMTDDLAFEPTDLAVSVGDTVTWETTGSVPHSVTAYGTQLPEGAAYFASGGFDSAAAAREGYPEGSVESGESYSHTFETSGEFPYFCIPHESSMRGTVVVE